MGLPQQLDGLFHGKSPSKMDDLVVPPFMEPPYIFLFDGLWCDIWMIPNMEGPELVTCE